MPEKKKNTSDKAKKHKIPPKITESHEHVN